HELLAAAMARDELEIADLAFRLHSPHELEALGRIPVQRLGTRQRVDLLGVRVAENVDEGRIDRNESTVATALVHAFRDGLEQPTEFRFALAQRFFCKAPLDSDARELRGMRHGLLLVA